MDGHPCSEAQGRPFVRSLCFPFVTLLLPLSVFGTVKTDDEVDYDAKQDSDARWMITVGPVPRRLLK